MTETEAIRENYNLGVLAGEARELQRVTNLIDKYCDGHHSALDGCECAILIALIKGEK